MLYMVLCILENLGVYLIDLFDLFNMMEEIKEVFSCGGWVRILKGGLYVFL